MFFHVLTLYGRTASSIFLIEFTTASYIIPDFEYPGRDLKGERKEKKRQKTKRKKGDKKTKGKKRRQKNKKKKRRQKGMKHIKKFRFWVLA